MNSILILMVYLDIDNYCDKYIYDKHIPFNGNGPWMHKNRHCSQLIVGIEV